MRRMAFFWMVGKPFLIALRQNCPGSDHLRGDVRQLTSLPGFHMVSHRLEVTLHSVHTNRNAVDDGERLRVLRQHRRERTCDNVAELTAPAGSEAPLDEGLFVNDCRKPTCIVLFSRFSCGPTLLKAA